jgi:hypothetical protein
LLMVLAHHAAETFVAETAEPLVRLVPHRGKATTRRSAVPATRIDKGSTVARRRGPRAWLHWRDRDLCPCRRERRELETALGTHDAGETRFEPPAVGVREDGGIPAGFQNPYRRSNRASHRRLRVSKWVSRSGQREGARALRGPVSGRTGEGLRRQASAGVDDARSRTNPPSRTTRRRKPAGL